MRFMKKQKKMRYNKYIINAFKGNLPTIANIKWS